MWSDLPKICWDMLSRQLEWSGITACIEAVSHLPISVRIQAGQWTGRMFRPNIAHKIMFRHVPHSIDPLVWKMWVSIASWFYCCGSKRVWTTIIPVGKDVWEARFFDPQAMQSFPPTHPKKKKKTWALLGNLPKKKRIFHLRFSLCFIFARVWISGADLFVGAGITGFVLSLPINQSGETFPEVGAHILRICSIFICVPDCRNICLYYEKRSHVLVPPILRIILLTRDVLVHVIAHRWRRSECYSASWVPRNRHFHPPKLLSNSLGEQYQT